MKLLSLLSLLTLVVFDVTGHTLHLSKELIPKADICDSAYSCADCYTARICRTNVEGFREPLRDISCPRERPYCDRSTGTCVVRRQSNCPKFATNSLTDTVGYVCNKIFSCLDCNTAQICKPTNNGLVHFKNIACTDDSPYCNAHTGTCGTEQGLGCGKKDKFVCVRDGKFPDTDCGIYHICTNLTSVTYSCVQPNEHYDPATGKCTDTISCQSFSCLNSIGMKVPHPLNPRYFAFCGDQEVIVIDSCPSPYELNATSQVCEATCHHNGLIQNLDDCRFYYKCTQILLTESMSYFKKEKKKCPDGQAYDPSQYLCVSDISDISGIPGCKV